MTSFTLFEVCWEICNKISGIHTAVVGKTRTMVERYGDDYVVIGPWLLQEGDRELPFEEEPGFEGFAETCRQLGVPVRVGRWKVPGRPRAILVEFSGRYEAKDAILSGLWERWRVDSISGGWDYVEPVLFGHAAGMVIEAWWEERLAPQHRRAVAQFHEWMTCAGLLYLKSRVPAVGTVFTSHATVVGRALAARGSSPHEGLGERDAGQWAEALDVVAKHSLEGVAAREADVLTTVSEITARETERVHGRRPDPVTPNGLDLESLTALVGGHGREEVRARLVRLASRFTAEDLSDAVLVGHANRYEFHNKGTDLLLDALARVVACPGRSLVAFLLVPAGNSGVRAEVVERLASEDEAGAPLGLATHKLFDEERDPIRTRCAELGLANVVGSRVKVLHVPIYLGADDDLLRLPHEAVLGGVDLSCFPAYYEPWGYAPQESLGLGVPTVTSDYAGFGRWCRSQELGPADGVTVLSRARVEYEDVVTELAERLERLAADGPPDERLRERCRLSAARTSWVDLLESHLRAHRSALAAVHARLQEGVPLSRPPRPARPLELARSESAHLVAFDVAATLPPRLRGLERLAHNLWWAWDPDAPSLFAELSPRAWTASGHNPVVLLRRVYPEDLAARAADAEFQRRLDRTLARLDAYLAQTAPAWSGGGPTLEHPVAYLCAEYALHESLPVYSGGLGILAGDHLKAASDLNLPLVAVGLFYRGGYLRQRVSADGEQLALELENDPRDLPLEAVRGEDGRLLEVRLQLPGRELALRAWKVQVGRVALYLLDSDVDGNRPEDRRLTRQLYAGDAEARLQQEICLGRGGVRLLRALSIVPSVWHMNEGHAAFLALERVAGLIKREGLTFDEARELVRATTLFTTHTPVPAGHDRFGEDLMRRYFSDAADWAGLPWERFYELGQAEGRGEGFNMTYLALSFASFVNGVSELHGIASRKLLSAFWPRLLESEVPVVAITNGVHLPTWTGGALARRLGAEDRPVRGAAFARAAPALDDNALWTSLRTAKSRLVRQVADALNDAFLARNDSPVLLTRMLDGLDPDALLIGFARRFAPYKRAQLVFQDVERLRALLDDEERPVRILVAGKAHPSDALGKDLVRRVVQLSRDERLVGRVFFVEDYDVVLARALVQGVDVWLNNPARMQEASGTSGMKAAANGALNLSIGDGWWPEGYDGENGWMIGGGRVYEEQALQDQLDAAVLYRLLEEEVVPLYFRRDAEGLPRGWLARVKHSLATLPPRFDTERMVREYAERAYERLARAHAELSAERCAAARAQAHEKARIRRGFAGLRIVAADVTELGDLKVGDPVEVRVRVELGELTPEDLEVELVLGHRRSERDLGNPVVVRLTAQAARDGAAHVFTGGHAIQRSGSYAYGIRLRARRLGEGIDTLENLIVWA